MLKLMYITNDPAVAAVAVEAGVERIFIDMETRGKAERQRGMDTVQSHHTPRDIARVREAIGSRAEIMARIDPLHEDSQAQIDASILSGADVIMLPMWRTAEDLRRLVEMVAGRARVMPLLETDAAAACLPEAVRVSGIDEMHIGLNDLHLCLRQRFLFEPLADGTVERLGAALCAANIPYGFGGIGRIGTGALPAECILAEHYRLHSSFAILSRSFCRAEVFRDHEALRQTFLQGVAAIRTFERECAAWTPKALEENRREVISRVAEIVRRLEA